METQQIVVTGVASGIGAATSQELMSRGFSVIGIDRDKPSDERVPFVQADLSSPAGVALAVEGVRNISSGGLHGLANIAGVPGTAPWELVQKVNVFGVRELTLRLVPLMNDGGAVVNLASAVAYRWRTNVATIAQFCAHDDAESALAMASASSEIREESYLFSKQCVRYLTEMHAANLLVRNIRVNSVSPGPIETPILEDFKSDHGRDKVESARHDLGRFGQAIDVAQVVAHLFDPAMNWVNGTDIRVDGGLTALREIRSLKAN